MDDNNSMEIALDKLSLQENDAIVVKFRYGSCSALDMSEFVSAIKSMVSNPIIVLPDDMDIGTKSIDSMIQYLEDMKKN